jgi:biopolymer transport protein TolR
MITAPLLTQGIQVDLPDVATEPLPVEQNEPLVVSVDRDGSYYLNIGEDPDTPVDAQTLVTKVAAVMRQKPATQVLVKGDEQVSYGQVVTAMSLLQQAGAGGLGLLTETP